MTFSEVFKILCDQYKLDIEGTHGKYHWARVYHNGMRLGDATRGANLEIIKWFSILHDCGRQNEHTDDDHPIVGGAKARIYHKHLGLTELETKKLIYAIAGHTAGEISTDPTVGCCWDADRLDLLRVGITPTDDLLSTREAKQPAVKAWANQRAKLRVKETF